MLMPSPDYVRHPILAAAALAFVLSLGWLALRGGGRDG